MGSIVTLCRLRWRLLVAAGGGLVAFALAQGRLALPDAAPLLGWVVGAAVFIVTTVWMFMTMDEDAVRARAAQEDENRGILTTLILMAVVASLAVAVVAIHDSKLMGGHPGPRGETLLLALSVSTLVLSWLIAQCLFVLHYTHRYFGDKDNDGTEDGGIKFPGEPPTTYRDFVYVAVCIGATCQVSDFNITTSRFRGLVTTHALFSFAFNTMILALGVNILAGMLGQ